jgi:hypothetical protein
MSTNPYESPQAEPEPAQPAERRDRVTFVEIAVLLFGAAVAAVTLLLIVTEVRA